MRPFLPLVALAVLCATLPGADVAAGVPNALMSTVGCVRACPGGDLLTHVVVRDIASNPIANSQVVIDFSQCPGYVNCPSNPPPLVPPNYTWDPLTRTARMLTDPTGTADFYLTGGGLCIGSLVTIYADGVTMAQKAISSPDQNGDLAVDPADLAIESGKVGTSDVSGDLDCNGTVTATDATQLTFHYGHTCEFGATPAVRRSWGSVKQIYR